MPSVSAPDLLSAWEAAGPHRPARRALALLAATDGGTIEGAAGLSIGARDARLLELRMELLGPELQGLADCPRCGTTVEFACDARGLLCAPAAEAAELRVALGPWRVRLRPPDGADLVAIEDAAGLEQAVRHLLERCVQEAEHDGEPVPAAALPPEVAAAIGERLGEADPQADVTLGFGCPACGFAWDAAFDAAAFLWTEIEALAQRMLDEVHLLASAYGWTEAEILRLSPQRRRRYIERIGA
ncbi:hypothetical protein ACFQX4_19350 [Roseomonas sp. GCM10028921]